MAKALYKGEAICVTVQLKRFNAYPIAKGFATKAPYAFEDLRSLCLLLHFAAAPVCKLCRLTSHISA